MWALYHLPILQLFFSGARWGHSWYVRNARVPYTTSSPFSVTLLKKRLFIGRAWIQVKNGFSIRYRIRSCCWRIILHTNRPNHSCTKWPATWVPLSHLNPIVMLSSITSQLLLAIKSREGLGLLVFTIIERMFLLNYSFFCDENRLL